MRTIKEGQLPPPKMYHGECPKCHGIFEFTEYECYVSPFDGKFIVICATPNCKKSLNVKEGIYENN